MMVNSGGMSGYSAMTFTPPAETSVIMQSRGSAPVPNWIFATRLHRRRSLLRRFASMSILHCPTVHPPSRLVYRRIVGIGLAKSLAIDGFCLGCFYRMASVAFEMAAPVLRDEFSR